MQYSYGYRLFQALEVVTERQVMHMQSNVSALLDKAKVMHKLPSDYKLALVMGVSQASLANYRMLKTLPDARVIQLLCDLTGDDPAILLAEVEAQRAKTDEARALWREVVQRLKTTLHIAVLSALVSLSLAVSLPSESNAAQISKVNAENIHCGIWQSAIFKKIRAMFSPLVRYFNDLFLRPCHV